MRPDKAEIDEAKSRLAGKTPEEVLTWALGRFRGRVAVASSFSIEDCVVIDLAHRIDPSVRVFALDTGRLPEETFETAERVREKYRATIEWRFPARQKVEALEQAKGLFSFMESVENRQECCGIRKVEPLGAALADLDAWITGLRREQAITRADTPEVELDAANGGLGKVNPIIGWTWAEVRAYAEQHKVPVHPLHDRGYPSIGCAPCTRAIGPGEHARAGRWWWESPDGKECGLHPARR